MRFPIAVSGLTVVLLAACWPAAEDGRPSYEAVVPLGAPFHGVHGLRFDAQDQLYAASVIGQSVFAVDTDSGSIRTIVGPPEGMADDIAIANDGTLVWTAIEDGIVYARDPNGTIRRLMENQRGVNAVAFSPDGSRLFVSLVFYGDALYELDLAGQAPPRLIANGLGGLNAFEVNVDGMIYGPLVFGGKVVQIDPDTGLTRTISDDFDSAGALKLESTGSALVLDDGARLKRVNLASGDTTVVAELPYGADNLDIDSSGRVFVSLSEVNAIVEVDPATGDIRYVVPPAPLTSPTGIAVLDSEEGRQIYVGDLFGGVKLVNPETGAIEKSPVDIFQPAHVSVTDRHLLVVGQVFGIVQLLDRETYQVLGEWDRLERPGDALEGRAGSVFVAETGAGRILRIDPTSGARQVLVDGLSGPVGLAWLNPQTLLATEADGGRLLRIDVASGESRVIVDGLAQPEGVAVGMDGGALVVEVGARRLTRVDLDDGSVNVLIDELPVGLGNGPSLYRGIAVGGSTVYFSSDLDNTIYRLTLE